jgi:hypothetical protein
MKQLTSHPAFNIADNDLHLSSAERIHLVVASFPNADPPDFSTFITLSVLFAVRTNVIVRDSVVTSSSKPSGSAKVQVRTLVRSLSGEVVEYTAKVEETGKQLRRNLVASANRGEQMIISRSGSHQAFGNTVCLSAEIIAVHAVSKALPSNAMQRMSMYNVQ